jgi:hypothetical protein
VRTIAQKQKLPQAVAVVADIQRLDTHITGCHFMAHVVAEQAVMNKQESFTDVLKHLPGSGCTGGYIMGAIEGYRMIDSSFQLNKDTIRTICQTTEQSQADAEMTCYHTMGHLLLADHHGDIDKTIQSCYAFADINQYECMNGIFMEKEYGRNLAMREQQPADKWTHETITQQQRLCETYTDSVAKACWRELSHMFVVQYESNPKRVYSACTTAPKIAFRDECYLHAVGVMTLSSDFNKDYQGVICMPYETSDDLSLRCMQMVVQTLLQTSSNYSLRAEQFCQSVSEDRRKQCFAFTRL